MLEAAMASLSVFLLLLSLRKDGWRTGLERLCDSGRGSGGRPAGITSRSSDPVGAAVILWTELVSFLVEVVGHLAPGLLRLCEARLLSSGLHKRISAGSVLASKVAALVLGALLTGMALGGLLPEVRLQGAIVGAVVGWLGPDLWLGGKRSWRRHKILGELPGMAELLVICAEAGLNLSRSLEVVARGRSGPLADEFRDVIADMAVGKRLPLALKAMEERVELPQVKAFCAALSQAERLGTPVGSVFRQQASVARAQFKHQLEARMATLPLKITICTVVFLFPTIFVVVLLPNILSFVHSRW